jgi:putative cardiolipin synthase
MCLLLVFAGCAPRPSSLPKPVSIALNAPPLTGLSGELERAAAAHPGKSGFAVIPNNRAAFTDRVALADFAQKTLDVQYYIWSADTIGRILGDHVIQAAERGVRVRCLIDDANLKNPDSALAALAAHPNIEVRLFHPGWFRSQHMADLLLDFGRFNHRMHNKTMVMDNSCAIIGGRNIADEYFGLNDEFNLRDLDIVAAGPIVRKVSAVFDEFWNSDGAVPIEHLAKDRQTIADFRRQAAYLREHTQAERYPFPLALDLREIGNHLTEIKQGFIWARGEVFHNSYDSLGHPGQGETVLQKLHRELSAAQREVHFEAAYYVMRRRGIEFGRRMVDRGVKIRVLTNSLATNDVGAAQAGYAKTRDTLLRGGVELYELRPDAAALVSQVAPHARQARTGVHTKALVIDGKKTFVGSYNLDPRSADINSEIGLLVDSEEFAKRVDAYLDQGTRPENSYRVTLDGRGGLQWKTTVDGEQRVWHHDPETTAWQRLTNYLIGLLPIQDQL